MLDNTSKRILDKLLNKVRPADLGIKTPVFLRCRQCFPQSQLMIGDPMSGKHFRSLTSDLESSLAPYNIPHPPEVIQSLFKKY